jgi:hypothetical protein
MDCTIAPGGIVHATPFDRGSEPMPPLHKTIAFAALTLALMAASPARAQQRARNIVFILADDHRYDAMSFMGHPIVRTPSIDRIAKRGVHLRNAFVTTALCSPSRATILTGLYAHQHKVVDNNTPVPAGTTFFPQYLQRAGYQTALFGKWHMGGDDGGPQPGFDHWVSFKGQGSYLPSADGLNVNGNAVPQKGYITDELTDYSLEWLKARDRSRPFFVYLSHKGVHNDYVAATRTSNFIPAERHRGKLESSTFQPPKSQSYPPELEAQRPRWVRDQRNSWHGVDHPFNTKLDIAEYFQRYAETLRGVDDSIGRVLEYLGSEHLPGAHSRRAKRGTADGQPRRRSDAPGGGGPHPPGLHARCEHPPPRAGAKRALAQGARVRILLGAKLSPDPDGVRAARRPVQVHPLLRSVGRRRVVRPARGSPRAEQPGLPSRALGHRQADE